MVLSLANLPTSHHLITAGGWVDVAGLAAALAAVAMVGWGTVVAGRRALAMELGAAAAATFLLVLGGLVTVAASGSTAGDILTALGLGAWAALLVVVAARTSMAERSPVAASPGAATAWLVAAGGLVLLAVGSGLPAPARSDSTTGVVAACLGAVGLAVLAGVLVAARSRRLLTSRAVATTVAGLAALAAHEVALAAYAAVSFTPTSTLGDVRSTVALAAFVGALAWVVLGLAAWQRIPEVPAWPLAVPPHPVAPPPPRCPACAAPAGPGANYCWQCGVPLGVPPSG